jgi:O-antigen ligase
MIRPVSARFVPEAAAAVSERLRSFDSDPRTYVFGALVGGIEVVLMALNLDGNLRSIGWIVVAISVMAPTAGLTVIATLALFREPIGLGPLGFNATVIGACALGVTGRLMVLGLARRPTSFRPEFVAIAAFLGISAFQLLSIGTRLTDQRELFARRQFTEVAGGLLLVVLVGVAVSPRARSFLVAALVPGIIVAGLAAIASLSPALMSWLPIWGLLPSQDVSARGTGIFYNPNYLGQAMVIGVLILASARRLGLPSGLARRPWLGVIAPLLGLVASFSRGALLALVSGVVALYWGRGRRNFLIAVLAGILVVLVSYPVILGARHALTFGPDVALSEEAQQVSDRSRIAVLRAGVKLFIDSPLVGVGYGQFHYESPKYLKASPITYPHNNFLQILAEQGLVGLGAFMLVLLALFVALSRRGDAYAVVARAMLVAFAVGALFAEPLTSLQTTAIMWIVVGAALAPTEPDDPPGEPAEDWLATAPLNRWSATSAPASVPRLLAPYGSSASLLERPGSEPRPTP